MGSKVEMHVKPDKRGTWAPHTVTGFYIGNAWEHYRCHQVWIVDTKDVRIGDTVFFKHKYLTMPTITTADALIKAADDLSKAVQKIFPQKGSQEAVEKLMEIFKQESVKHEDAATSQRVKRD